MNRQPAKDRPNSLGDYVRQAREQAGLSVRQLAAEAGVAASNISRIENGETTLPTLELLKRIADVLDIDLAELLEYRGISLPKSPDRLNAYLRQQYQLPDKGIQEAQQAIEQIAAKYKRKQRSQD
ncbi:MAG: helix-turn-helix domain-containing protein [Egibacteraceae bacterium]